MRAAPAAGDDEAIERKIAVRAARQERLTADDPPECWAVLNEAVIRRVVGGADVMRAQLDHIAEHWPTWPHVNGPGAAVPGRSAPGDGRIVHHPRLSGGRRP